MKGLSIGLISKERENIIFGIKVKQSSSTICHLLFADGCYVYAKVNPREVVEAKNTLREFGEASIQVTNLENFDLIFNSKTSHQFKNIIQSILQIKHVDNLRK